MKKVEFNLDKVQNLKEFYQEFDKQSLSLKKSNELLNTILQYKNKTNSLEEKQKLEWELEANLFNIHGGSLFAFSTSNGKNVGEILKYPQLDEYQKTAFEYLVSRANSSNSYYFRAKYNFLLWHSIIKKDNNHALDAISNYILTINDCTKELNNDIEFSFLIGRFVETLISITSEVNFKIQDTINLTEKLLSTNELSLWAKYGIIEDMLKYPKIFKAESFKTTLTIFHDRLNFSKYQKDDFLLVNNHLQISIKVAQKIKSDVKIWYEELGNANLRLADGESDDSRNWIKLDYYRAAIDAFRLSGNKLKKKQAEQLYFELKPQVTLEEIRIDHDEETIQKLRKINTEVKEYALSLLKPPLSMFTQTLPQENIFLKLRI